MNEENNTVDLTQEEIAAYIKAKKNDDFSDFALWANEISKILVEESLHGDSDEELRKRIGLLRYLQYHAESLYKLFPNCKPEEYFDVQL